MRIIITLDESLTAAAHIEGVTSPNQPQCLALREIAALIGRVRWALEYTTNPISWPDNDPEFREITNEAAPTLVDYQTYIAALVAKSARGTCPVCEHLWCECECGVIAGSREPFAQAIPLLTDEHSDRVWKDKNGDWWRYHYEDDRHGWQYSHGSERWRWGGMHLAACGPFTEVNQSVEPL